MAARLPSPSDLLRRLLAGGSAALVLALAVFSASPVLHDELHHDDAAPAAGEDHCAIALFASGVSLVGAAVAPAPPASTWREQPAARATEIFLSSPRYLRQPERGPPSRV